jgi:uncharacterized protein
VTFSIADGYPASWRREPGLPLLASHRWHRAMRGRLDGRAYWFSELNGDRLAAGLAGFLVPDPDVYPYGSLHALLLAPDTPFGDDQVRRVLRSSAVPAEAVLPSLVLTYPGYATFAVGQRAHSPRALLTDIVQWAGERGAAAVALPYAEAGGPLAAAAGDLGFVAAPLTCDSWLHVPAGGFEHLAAGLDGHRRRRVRAERRRIIAAGLRARLVTRFDPALLSEFGRLRAAHRHRYGLPADAGAETGRLTRLVRELGGAASATVVTAPDGALLSFAVQARDGDVWHEVCGGTDHADGRSRFAYFEATFYGPVDAAGPRGIRRISFGIAAERAKLHRGARLVPLSALMLGLTPASRAAAGVVRVAWSARRRAESAA